MSSGSRNPGYQSSSNFYDQHIIGPDQSLGQMQENSHDNSNGRVNMDNTYIVRVGHEDDHSQGQNEIFWNYQEDDRRDANNHSNRNREVPRYGNQAGSKHQHNNGDHHGQRNGIYQDVLSGNGSPVYGESANTIYAQRNMNYNTSLGNNYSSLDLERIAIPSNDANRYRVDTPVRNDEQSFGNVPFADEPLLDNDNQPTIIKKKIEEPITAYNQSVWIRYLQPPNPPAPGPIIIKEIREKQPDPLPPVIIRQRPQNPQTPPPLILREKPPLPPCVPSRQVVVKRLPAPPAPPRQVIVERYPPLPPKPRDIIIEKWLPYKCPGKRSVIVHRAPPLKLREPPKNVIIQYVREEPKVCRTYKKLGVESMNPDMYKHLYRHELMDPLCFKSVAYREGVLDAIEPCSARPDCATYLPSPHFDRRTCCIRDCQPMRRSRSCSTSRCVYKAPVCSDGAMCYNQEPVSCQAPSVQLPNPYSFQNFNCIND